MLRPLVVLTLSFSLISCIPGDFPGQNTSPESSASPQASSGPDVSPSTSPEASASPSSEPDVAASPEPTSSPGATPSSSPGACRISSLFVSENDGWRVVGDAEEGSGIPEYRSSGGNPDGYLNADDDATGGTWYWSAPETYLGDQSAAYGQSLQFDLKQSSTTRQFDNSDIILEGGGLTLVLALPHHPETDWTSYELMLNTNEAWKHNSLDGETASAADLQTALGDLKRLWIRGEYVEGADNGGLDNVYLHKACASPSGATISSYFDNSDEEWRVVGDAEGGSGSPDYHSSEGNPGGYLSADDDAAGGTWYWSAPARFLGNQADKYQKFLRFDLKQSSTNSQFENSDIILEGAGRVLVFTLPRHPGLDWTSYEVHLDASANWLFDSQSGSEAGADDLQAVLNDLERLWIRGEYVEGNDTGGLDNVIFG